MSEEQNPPLDMEIRAARERIAELEAQRDRGHRYRDKMETRIAGYESTLLNIGVALFGVGFDKTNDQFVECIAELEREREAHSFPGHYISTACQRDRHQHCRLTDKWTSEPCKCSCGHPATTNLPVRSELKPEPFDPLKPKTAKSIP